VVYVVIAGGPTLEAPGSASTCTSTQTNHHPGRVSTLYKLSAGGLVPAGASNSQKAGTGRIARGSGEPHHTFDVIFGLPSTCPRIRGRLVFRTGAFLALLFFSHTTRRLGTARHDAPHREKTLPAGPLAPLYVSENVGVICESRRSVVARARSRASRRIPVTSMLARPPTGPRLPQSGFGYYSGVSAR